jgi:uncharacterized protein YycO
MSTGHQQSQKNERERERSAPRSRAVMTLLAVLLAATLLPTSALATDANTQGQSGWELLEAYALDKTGDPAVAEEIERAKEAYGRELTDEEVEIWKKGVDAQYIADKATAGGRELTSEELKALQQSAEAVFGTAEEIRAGAEQAMREKYPAPPPTQIIDLGKATGNPSPNAKAPAQPVNPSALATTAVPLEMQSIMPEVTAVPAAAQATTDDGYAAQNAMAPLFHRTPAVGAYPHAKGKILVTADFYSNSLPTGHAGIVYDGGISSNKGTVESIDLGVRTARNDWEGRCTTCFGLDVNVTNASQESAAADWCYSQIGAPFNWNLVDKERYGAYYCSQLVWRAYMDTTGVNLDVDRIPYAVHPTELIDSQYTSTIYRHGNYLTSSWDNIYGKWYYFDANGYYLHSGMYNIGGQNYYFAPTGELVAYYRAAFLASAMGGSKVLDVPNASLSSGTQLIIWDYNNGNNQVWDIFSPDGSTMVLQSRHSKKVADIYGGIPGNEVPVIQWDYHGSVNQRWYLYRYSDGSYQFRSAANSAYALDVAKGLPANGAKMIVWPYSGNANQRWFI